MTISSGILGSLLVSAGSLWRILLAPIFVTAESPGTGIYVVGSIVIFGIFLLSRLTPTPTRPVR